MCTEEKESCMKDAKVSLVEPLMKPPGKPPPEVKATVFPQVSTQI